MAFTKVERIGCQVCLERFPNVGQFKSHMRGKEHQKKMTEVFPKGKFNNRGFFCSINVMEYLAKHQPERLIIGLSMVTVCSSTELRVLFYLCHLCEETCTQEQIMDHLFSPAHLINHYTYTDPDVLSFSWFPGMSMFKELKPIAKEDIKKNGNGVLQVLDLPKDLFNVIRRLPYASAMSTLEENEKLASQLKESKPKRISVQSYVADPSRKHALLGLQHLVECICDGEGVKGFHLCTLCQITLRGNAIISHVISFDHVYRYINAWHPSTLKSKHCYTEFSPLKPSICHYARQAEERSGTDNNIKELTVTTEVFNSLEASYSKALVTLETISRECNGRSLITSVQPGDPLETVVVSRMSVTGDKGSSKLKERPTKPSFKLRCQNCKMALFLPNYIQHVNNWSHTAELKNIFGSAVEDEDQKFKSGIPYLELCRFIKHTSEEPIIGLPFIVVCICSKAKSPPLHLCFACLKYFSEAEVWKHMSSQRHALYTVLRQRVPFAWAYEMDTKVLRQLALEEQQANGDHILKVFDIPYCIFSKLKLTFLNLTEGEELQKVQCNLRNEVPLAPTPKPEYPLLGQDFVVRYSVTHGRNAREWRFLCLLCGRNLGRKESTAHVLSYEHAQNFLEKAHCGSLDCSDVSRETLLDLAQQAAKIHPVSEIQTIRLKEPLLDSVEYLKAVEILQIVKWSQSNSELIPVLAAGKRLVPTGILQEIGHAEEKTRAESEKATTESGQSAVNKLHSTSHSPPWPGPPKVEPNSPVATTGGLPGGVTNEKKVAKEKANTATPDTTSKCPVESQPESSMEPDSHPAKKIKEEPKMRNEEKNEPSEVAPVQTGMPVNIKQEPLSSIKLETSDSSWQSLATSPKGEPDKGREEAGVQVSTESSTQTCITECKNETAMLGKRKASGSSDQEVGSKRPSLCPENEPETRTKASGHLTGMDNRNATEKALLKDVKPTRAQIDNVPGSPPASSFKLWDFIKLKDREPVIGLHALFECHCEPNAPIYLCKCCCVQIPEKDILAHITGVKHRMGYLKLPSINVKRKQRAARHAAAKHEQRAGFGEAQVVELTPEVYSEVLQQSYDLALKNVLACQNTLQRSAPAPKVVTCKPDALRPSAQPSPSVALLPTPTTAPLVSGTGKTTHVAPQTKAQQTENKAASSPTLESGTTVKGSGTDATFLSTGTRKLFVPKTGIPAKKPVEKCVPLSSIISVAPSLSLSTSQSRVTFATPLVTSPKSIPSTTNTLKTVSNVVSALKSAKLLRTAASSKIEAQTGDNGPTNHDAQPLPEAQQLSLSVTLSPTSNTASLASDPDKTTRVPPKTKVQQTGWLENKATTLPTLNSGATVKVSRTDANSQITVTSKSDAHENGIPAKTPVDEFIPAPSIKTVATSLSISPSQSSVTVVKTPVTSSKSIPSTMNTLTTSSKGVNASKSVNPLRAGTSSKHAAPTVDKVRTNHDASTMHKSTPIPQSGMFSHTQPAVPGLPTSRPLVTKPQREQSTASTEQGLGSASPTTPVYSTSTFPLNHTAVADSSKVKSSSKNQDVGIDHLVAVVCEKRRQCYCLLCSVRLKNNNHMISNSHRYKYLKFRFFDWPMEGDSEMDEKKMLRMVTHLAAIEKAQGIVVKKVEVNSESYNQLATVSEEEALAKVKELLESQSHSSTSASKAEGPKCVSGSHGASLSADEVDPNPGAKPRNLTGVARAAVKPTPEPARTSPSSARTPPPNPSTTTPVQVEIVGSAPMEEATICKEESDQVPHPVATGSPITHALPSLPRALEEPKTQPDPAPRREPGPKRPMGRPMAELVHSSSANATHNGESFSESGPQMEPKGEKILGLSDLSNFLMVHCNTKPIIGLAFVFECRAPFEETFYLCGSCRKTIPFTLICEHIVSVEHQRTYMLKDYPQFMSWWNLDIQPEMKEELLRDIAWKISEIEVYDQMDAQVIMLHKDCYDYIRQAPFIQALDTLQNISREKKLSHLFGHQIQPGPQTSDAPAATEPRSADASVESNAREKDMQIPGPIYSFPQDTVNSGPTLAGIGAIVECSCEGQTPFYLCVACSNRLSQDLVLPHVKSQRHLQKYLSARYPWADEVGVEPAKLLQLARGQEEQNPDEPSTMQRISLPQKEFSMIQTMMFDQALPRLKTICGDQLLTCVTSKPQPVKRPFEVGWSDSDRGKSQRLSSPPTDHVTQALLTSPVDPWPPVKRSRLMDHEEKGVWEASEPLLSQAHAPAPQALADRHATQPATRSKRPPSSNFEPNPNRPPASMPVPLVESMESLTRAQPVERAASFPVSCPHSLAKSNTQAAAIPLVCLTHEHKKGAVPSAHKPFKTGNSIAINNAADIEMYLEAGGCSKDETKHAVNHDPRSKVSQSVKQCRQEESAKMTISYYPVQPRVSSSVPSANNCSAGSFPGALGRIGVITGVSNTSNPHTADPGTRLPQEDLGFRGCLRQEQIQTGTNHNSRLEQIRNGPNRTLLQLLMEPASSHPIGRTGPLAANLSTTACSSRSASTQSNSHTPNITEQTPGITGSQGYSTGQPYYTTTPYHASGYLDYHHPSLPMAVDSAIHNPPLYSANMNHSVVGTQIGGPLNQSLQQQIFGHGVWPNQEQSIAMARGLTQYSWPSVTPATAVAHGATAPSYHDATVFSSRAANYSQWLQRDHTFRNHIVMSDPGQPQAYKHSPGEGAGGVEVLEDEVESRVDCIVHRRVGFVGSGSRRGLVMASTWVSTRRSKAFMTTAVRATVLQCRGGVTSCCLAEICLLKCVNVSIQDGERPPITILFLSPIIQICRPSDSLQHPEKGLFVDGMQPDGTGAGPPNESLLYHSLKPYLDNKTRQQPIIGLDSVTECVKVGSCNQETLYLCEVCQSRMKRSDVRNHIMGSLHRYCYINARHPDLAIGWGQTVDVPKLAWPLMEMASVLEKREGPGIVKVCVKAVEVHQNYVWLHLSPSTAVSQMAVIRREQMEKKAPHPSELTQTRLESSAVQPRRVQLSQKNCPVQSRSATVQCPKSNVRLQHFEVETDESTAEADTTTFKLPSAKSAEPCVQSESRDNILDGHTVIGLDCVVECRRKDDGRSSCFLCHCCRVKSDPGDVIDHLTSPSHISNYLMEVYPECVDAMMGGLNGEKELLQSVALRVAHIEGRGEHKVLEWPTHLCDQLSDKTYHWCVQMFSDGENSTSAARQRNTISVEGLDAFHQLTTRKDGIEAGSERAAKKRRTGNETNPVFKVSMPMSKGAFVLERASFSLPNSAAVGTPSSPPPDPSAPETLARDPLARDPLASHSNLDFSPLTVTLFETALTASPPRHIEVQSADMEENIPVVVRHRKETEDGPGWGFPTQGSRTEAYKQSPSHNSFYPPCPQEKLQYTCDAQTCPIPHDPAQATGAGLPADGVGCPGASLTEAGASLTEAGASLTEAGDVTPKTLSSCGVPVFHDHDSEKSDFPQKPAVTFYYCTPEGQRRP
ncbi:unnamed protein product [Lota lota]